MVPATHYGMGADVPLEMLVTVTFEDLGGKTRMTLRHEGLPAGEMSDGAGSRLERVVRQARRSPGEGLRLRL